MLLIATAAVLTVSVAGCEAKVYGAPDGAMAESAPPGQADQAAGVAVGDARRRRSTDWRPHRAGDP